jgi:hypothetical protein
MTQLYRITKQGLEALRQEHSLDPEMELILEIMSRVEKITQSNAMELCVALIDRWGSAELATEALQSGAQEIEFVPLQWTCTASMGMNILRLIQFGISTELTSHPDNAVYAKTRRSPDTGSANTIRMKNSGRQQ